MATTVERQQLEDELMAVLQARKELNEDEERHLVESFLERIDREIDARIDARLEAGASGFRGSFSWPAAAVVITATILALPIAGVAGTYAGATGVVVTLVALLLLAVIVSVSALSPR